MKRLTIPLFILILLSACETDQIMTYRGVDNIYINAGVSGEVFDYSRYTFRSTADSFLDIPIVIRIQGPVSAIDRPYILSPDLANSTAVDGVDYTFSETNPSISAGNHTDTLIIRFLNNENALNRWKKLVLVVQPNEYFSTNYKSFYVTHADSTASHIQHTYIFGDVAITPDYWESSLQDQILGTFSAAKVALLVEVGGLNETRLYPLTSEDEYTDEELSAAARLVQVYLNQQNAMGNSILDENNNPITMGTQVQ